MMMSKKSMTMFVCVFENIFFVTIKKKKIRYISHMPLNKFIYFFGGNLRNYKSFVEKKRTQ